MQKVYLDELSYSITCDYLAKIVSVLKKSKLVDAVFIYSYASSLEEVANKDDLVFNLNILVEERNLKAERKLLEKIYNLTDALMSLVGIEVSPTIVLTNEYCEFLIYKNVSKGQILNVSEVLYDRTDTLKKLKDNIKYMDRFYDEDFEELEIIPPIDYSELDDEVKSNYKYLTVPGILLGGIATYFIVKNGIERTKK